MAQPSSLLAGHVAMRFLSPDGFNSEAEGSCLPLWRFRGRTRTKRPFCPQLKRHAFMQPKPHAHKTCKNVASPLASLDRLPLELMMMICYRLSPRRMYKLLLVSRRVYILTIPCLYDKLRESSEPDGTVFHWACKKGVAGTVHTLLEYDFNPHVAADLQPRWLRIGERIPTPLEVATRFARHDIMQLLLDHGADINSTLGCTTALIEAVGRKDLSTAEFLLLRGADPDLNVGPDRGASPTALIAAVSARSPDAVALLAAHGAELNPWEDRPLYWAVRYHDRSPVEREVILTLLRHGANPNAKGRTRDCQHAPTPLTRALQECSHWDPARADPERNPLEVVEILLQYRAEVDYIPIVEKEYPLHCVVNPAVHTDVLQFLLDIGADPDVTNPVLAEKGSIWTPLHKAMRRDVPARYAAVLLSGGASPIPRDAHRFASDVHSTPLGELVADHLGPSGRVARKWRIGCDWAKFCLLVAHGGPQIVEQLPRWVFAVLFSLTVSACRGLKQIEKHVVNFARMLWMKLADLRCLAQEERYLKVWIDERTGECMPGYQKAQEALEVLDVKLGELKSTR